MKLLLKTLFALFFLFSLSPFLTKPSLADINLDKVTPDTFANNLGSNPNGRPDESTWKVTLTFTGLKTNTGYWVCGYSCSNQRSEPSAEIKTDQYGTLKTYDLCASGIDTLVWSSCDSYNNFHGGNKYQVNVYGEAIGSGPLIPNPIYQAEFYVQWFYPAITLGENEPSVGYIKPTVKGTRRRHDDENNNNYDIVVQSQSDSNYDQDKCVTSKPDGKTHTPDDTFPQLTEPGKYIAYFREQDNEHQAQDTCQSPNGHLYWTINFKVDGTGKITNVSSPLKDPEGNDTSALLGTNPCQPTGSGPVVCPTAIGPIAADPREFVGRILIIATGLAGGIALIFMVIGSIKVLTSSGDQQKLNTGKDQIVAAAAGLLFLLFSVLILRFIGVQLFGFFTY